MGTQWQRFERIVAAVNRAADKGADVRWDEIINGRQFDVAIRYRKGLYDFLIVVECKDYKNPVPVEKIDAFVTKSRSVNANRAIVASTSCFQSGAITVATQNDIVLLHFIEKERDYGKYGHSFHGKVPVINIRDIEIKYSNGKVHTLPPISNEMNYCVEQSRIQAGTDLKKITDFIYEQSPSLDDLKDGSETALIPLPSGAKLISKDELMIPSGFVSELRFTAHRSEADHISSNVMIDPSIMLPDLEVVDVGAQRSHLFSLFELPFGTQDDIEVGAFYENPNLGLRYYITEQRGDTLSLILIESFQNGMLLQAALKQKVEHFSHSEKITDQELIRRLRLRLKNWQNKRED